MPGLDINQLLRLPAAKIFSALLVAMLTKAAGNINGNAGIQRVIGTKNYVNLPIHDALHNGAKKGTDGSSQAHSQCAPENDTNSTFNNT